jgi:hypothetical protein
MPRGQQSRGTCQFCSYETTKDAMGRHLAKCPARAEKVAAATKGRPETLFYLRMEDAYAPEFWLDIEARGAAKLKDIDTYLRAIWLECCGHLSAFKLGGWGGRDMAKTRTVEQIFSHYDEVVHIYDFGTSSETRIRRIDQHAGVPLTERPLVLMARNVMPQVECQECGQPATHLCMECMVEHDASGMLCDAHTTKHRHRDYGEPLALVNSPRLGMCGYDGPAEPPY